MKITGFILIFIGAVALLKNTGIIFEFDRSIIWPLALIAIGFAVKHSSHYYKKCHDGLICGSCGGGEKSAKTCGVCGKTGCDACKA